MAPRVRFVSFFAVFLVLFCCVPFCFRLVAFRVVFRFFSFRFVSFRFVSFCFVFRFSCLNRTPYAAFFFSVTAAFCFNGIILWQLSRGPGKGAPSSEALRAQHVQRREQPSHLHHFDPISSGGSSGNNSRGNSCSSGNCYRPEHNTPGARGGAAGAEGRQERKARGGEGTKGVGGGGGGGSSSGECRSADPARTR